LAKERFLHLQEWANRKTTWRGRSAIDGFPFLLKEPAETPQRLSHVYRDVLSFTVGLSQKSGHRDAPCSQPDRSHCPKPQRALENWIASVETELSATIVARHADLREDFFHAFLQIEVCRRCRMTQPLF